jgi:PAS domain S-box-containing protein
MKSQLRVLMLEDSQHDAALIVEELEQGGFELSFERIWTPDQMGDALDRGPWDVILSDYSMPGFDGLKGFSLLRVSGLDIPFILVSGTIGEELAVTAVKAGVSDYINKENLAPLVPAVKRELRNAKERQRWKQSEAALRESQLRLQAILDNSRARIFIKDVAGCYLQINREFERRFNLRSEEILGRTDAEIFPPEQATIFRTNDLEVVNRGKPMEFEEIVQYGEGLHTSIVHKFPLRDAVGKVYAICGIVVDITERKRAEDDLRKQKEILQTIFDHIPVMINFVGKDSRIELVNREWERILGWTFEELQAQHQDLFVDCYPDLQDRQRVRAFVAASAGDWGDFSPTVKSGKVIDTTWAVVRLLDGSSIGIGMDITERKRAEVTLRDSEERFRQVVENIHEVFWMTDIEKTRVLYISPGYERIWGHPCKDLYESPHLWVEAIHPDDRDRVLTNATTRQVAGNYNEEYRILRPDGTVRWIHDRAFPVKDKDGEVRRIVGIAEDITERKRTEEELRKSETELRVAFENAAIGMALLDIRGHPIKCNRALQQLLGYSEEELRQMSLTTFTHPDDMCTGSDLHQELMAGKREQYQIEIRYLRKDKGVVYARLTVSVVRGATNEPQYAIGMIEDMTEKKKLENQFMRAQRLESIGMLAGGIAHDLNNVLAPILMSCELMKQDGQDETSLKLLAIIRGSAKRGAELVKQVVSFASGAEGRRAPILTKHIIQEMVNISRQTFPKDIRIRTEISQNLWGVSGDSTQLDQVLLNLFVNARDAMPAGGDLTITAENVLVDTARAVMNPEARLGPHVVIKISDTGVGITPDMKEKIFEPFFTTKDLDKGTGLGLSTVLRIVKSHGGFISLNSELGKGATFEVWLPATTSEKPSPEQLDDIRRLRGHGELIFVVDDEAAVRTLTKQTLEAYDYRVLSAANGADAVALYERRRDEIEVVITDLIMPMMDGVVLVRAMMEINPAVRIIVRSGSFDTEHQLKALGAGAKKFLPKPYSVETLLTSLYEVLRNQ